MEHLFMKVTVNPRNRHEVTRVLSWLTAEPNAKSVSRGSVAMAAAEAGEFEFLVERGKSVGYGAGGTTTEYRVYERLAPVAGKYAIVRPTLKSVREKYPDACRIVNLDTGEESALSDRLENAQRSVDMLVAGKAKGSFGA